MLKKKLDDISKKYSFFFVSTCSVISGTKFHWDCLKIVGLDRFWSVKSIVLRYGPSKYSVVYN